MKVSMSATVVAYNFPLTNVHTHCILIHQSRPICCIFIYTSGLPASSKVKTNKYHFTLNFPLYFGERVGFVMLHRFGKGFEMLDVCLQTEL